MGRGERVRWNRERQRMVPIFSDRMRRLLKCLRYRPRCPILRIRVALGRCWRWPNFSNMRAYAFNSCLPNASLVLLRSTARAEESMADACEIARLPEELLSAAISRTAPRDACRAAAVSAAFRAAADSDAVWSCFLPLDPYGYLPLLPPLSKKARFLRLSDPARPVLLFNGSTSMWLDRQTGAKCYMLSARTLSMACGDTPRNWRLIPLTDSSFSEAAELLLDSRLEIRGEIHSEMLTQDSTYAAYIVFKMADGSYGLDFPVQEASVSIGEALQVYEDEDETLQDYHHGMRREHGGSPPGANVLLPQTRDDGWMELEIGELYNVNEKWDDGVVVPVSVTEIVKLHGKKGLIVQGIEIRAK